MTYKLSCIKTSKNHNGYFLAIDWAKVPTSPSFIHTDGDGGEAISTSVQAAWDREFLYVRFQCEDYDILASMQDRDDPLYEEEVVEVFLAPKKSDEYYEFNLSPKNVVFDSFIKHDGERHQGDPEWNCPELKHKVVRDNPKSDIFGNWSGYLAIPFKCLDVSPVVGDTWKANFYRIKRIGGDQYLAWSPTLTRPAYFHVPSKFGALVFI